MDYKQNFYKKIEPIALNLYRDSKNFKNSDVESPSLQIDLTEEENFLKKVETIKRAETKIKEEEYEEETIIKKKKSIILFQKSVKKIQDLINQKKEEEIKNQNLEKEFKYYNSSLLSKNEINFRRFSLTEKKFVEKKNSLEGSTIEKSKEKGEVFYKLSKKANLVEKFALKLRQSVGIQNCSTLTLKISEMINDLSFDFNNFCKIMLYNEGFLI